ncbi:hypothetical protein ACGFK1_04175 [Mycobacterium sp. NPDC048908]|uniref:hypothetical protein n=1 Tax=Mycobacterium sp. NPDC048908 TaxID=3364292 RepID=UPI00371DBCBA
MRLVVAAGVLIVGVAACSSTEHGGPSHADTLKAWRNQAQPTIDKMNDALAWFEGAVRSSDYPGAQSACRSFAEGVSRLEHELPSPDDDVTAVLEEAVGHFRDFDRECVTVNPEMTQDQANTVVSLRDKGIERIKTAVAMMDRLEQQ